MNKKTLHYLFLSFGLSLTSASGGADLYQQGVDAFKWGDDEKAVKIWEQAISSSNDSSAQPALAGMYFKGFLPT